jgi:hypothetical protein
MFFRKKPAVNEKLVRMEFLVSKESDFKKYLLYLSHPGHVIWRNFLAGTFQGVGFVVGSALFLTVVSFILKQVLGEIPFFSDFANALNLWLSSLQSPKG